MRISVLNINTSLMNYELNNIPVRTEKPRTKGFTMAMDKGLSLRATEDFVESCSDFVDIVKLGWATSYVTKNLNEKLAIYKAAGIPVYLGGTLFEAFLVRGQFEDYRKVLDKYDLHYAEVSDGSISLNHDKKCEYITTLAKQVTVLSEVGSKDAAKIIPPYKWIEQMRKELDAGAWKVIGEAREGLVEEILTQIPEEKIIWEAPLKSQQVWFIKLIGANVNLGNISPSEVIPLETIRLGLRGDTFDHFLGEIKL